MPKSIHIVSLQRTGSKSLVRAISKHLPNRLRFTNGDELEELLHLWFRHGYKFGIGAKKPFDKDHEIWFRTAPGFDALTANTSKNFKPKFDYATGELSWVEASYIPVLSPEYSLGMRDGVDAVAAILKKDVLLKTQVADMPFNLQVQRTLCEGWDHIIALIPRDVARWVCSNYLCDHSGVFVPVKEQKDAQTQYTQQKVTVPREYVAAKCATLNRHKALISSLDQSKVIYLYTEDLHTLHCSNQLSKLGLGSIDVPYVAEFSSVPYADMIENIYDVYKQTNSSVL